MARARRRRSTRFPPTTRCAASSCAAPARRRSRRATTSREFATERVEQGAGDASTARSCTRRRVRSPRAGIRWSRRSTASASAAGSRSPRCATCASAANRAASARRSRTSASSWRTRRWRRSCASSAPASRSRSCSRAASSARAEAKEKGLVTRVVPDDRGRSRSARDRRAHRRGAPLVARWHKKFARRLGRSARRSPTPKHDECFDCFDTEDFRIGYAAFLAKRKPGFNGR